MHIYFCRIGEICLYLIKRYSSDNCNVNDASLFSD